jgi:HEAT repeat protein
MVRTHALEAVARLGGVSALKHLLPLSEDNEVRIRSELCVALGMINTRPAQEKLQEMLTDRELAVRVQALDAFSKCVERDFGFRVEDHLGALDLKALEGAVKNARAFALPG